MRAGHSEKHNKIVKIVTRSDLVVKRKADLRVGRATRHDELIAPISEAFP